MGAVKFFSSSSYDNKPTTQIVTVEVTKPLPNPNPNNYKIIKHEQIGKYLIIEVKYLDCTNYEGYKIMLYECTYDDILKQVSIDPHFSNNPEYFSPIARFEPTKRGWEMARLISYGMINILKK